MRNAKLSSRQAFRTGGAYRRTDGHDETEYPEIGSNYPEHWSRTCNACQRTRASFDLGGIIHVFSSYTNDNLHLETSLHSQWLGDVSGIKIS